MFFFSGKKLRAKWGSIIKKKASSTNFKPIFTEFKSHFELLRYCKFFKSFQANEYAANFLGSIFS